MICLVSSMWLEHGRGLFGSYNVSLDDTMLA